jgi:hypothetical protein
MDNETVTTPSAKSDGFYVHARTSVPRSGRKAQSEPQDITGCIDITVNNQPAVRAKVNTVSKRFRNLGQGSTSGAYLRRSARVDLNKLPTSFFHFVGKLGKELSPTGIVDRPSEHTTRQPFDIQVLNGDKAVPIHQGSAELVLKVRPLVSNMSVSLLKQPDSFPATDAAFLPSFDFPLTSSHFRQFRFQVARVSNQFPVRERDKRAQSHIDAYSLVEFRKNLGLAFEQEAGIPLSRLPLQRQRLDLTDDRPVHLQLNNADALNFESTHLSDMTTIAPCRKRIAIETASGFEARIATLCTSLDAPKEVSKGLIDPPKHVLRRAVISQIKVACIPYLFKLSRLVVVAPGHSLHLPRVATFLKGGIVKRTSLGKLVVEGRNLCSRGIKAVLEGLKQKKTVLDQFATPRQAANRSWTAYLYYTKFAGKEVSANSSTH